VSNNYSLPIYVKLAFPYGDNTSYLTITFDNKDFFTSTESIGVTNFQKSFLINSKQYYAVSMIPAYNYIDTLYFSKDYGVIRIVSKGNQWNIIQ
jgi:hypothetical protein